MPAGGDGDRVLGVEWDELFAHRSDLRRWLVAAQADGETAGNWWRSVVLSATERIQSAIRAGSIPDQSTLIVALRAIDIAAEDGGVSRADRAARLANLAGLIADAGGVIGDPRELRPEVAAQQCLDLLPSPDARDELTVDDWRKLPVEEMQQLRRMKNQLTPLRGLPPDIGDARLSKEIAQWMVLYPQLP